MKLRKKLLSILICIVIAVSTCGCSLDDIIDIFTTSETNVEESVSVQTVVSDNPSVSESISVENTNEVSVEEPSLSDTADIEVSTEVEEKEYRFRNNNLWEQHYEKHGIEMGFETKEDYAAAANKVINNPESLHKIEKEDGDDVFFLESTGEFVVVSTDGYIRTYFIPSSGKKYFDKQ